MIGDVETEIKLVATPACLLALESHPRLCGPGHTAQLAATYYDTACGRLREAGAALRIREKRRGRSTTREQTVKLAAGQRGRPQRSEWNVAIAQDEPDLAALPPAARAALTRLLAGEAAVPFGATRVERLCRRVKLGDALVEAAFDRGTITAGAHEAPICELELELLRGRLADLLELALQLPLGPDLQWSLTSKSHRCHALAQGNPARAVPAQPPRLSADMSVVQGFRVIGWSCLGQLLANYPLLVATGDAEALHQCRVAMRRLRAAFSLFGEQVADEGFPPLRAGIKAVASALGPARDLHVLGRRLAKRPGREALVVHVEARALAATGAAQLVVSGSAFQRLLFELALWLESGAWAGRPADRCEDRPLLAFAGRVIAARRRKLARKAARLGKLSDDQLHRLRIEVKKLRYAVGFFAGLAGGKAAVRTAREHETLLGKLQEVLGDLHDAAQAEAARDDLLARLSPAVAARLGKQLDAALAEEAQPRRRLLKRAAHLFEREAEIARWWRAAEKRS